MADKALPKHLVFGLDIGTRSIVGTVGYKVNKTTFRVVAQVSRLHKTRAMMDGQIHDISKVSETISSVKSELEKMTGRELSDVCIAAAGRVLKTITVHTDYDLPEEGPVVDEQIHALELMAVEDAYEQLRKESNTDNLNFYCVGYTVITYYLNNYAISSLQGHKATRIGTDLIATFMPNEVVDGLYAAVEASGLYVANLTLEPIAAINVAIPESYRLLNLALVDVGAGTSDISITRDGSIVAFGMMPYAGDEITEDIVKHYLVDFNTAEVMKLACGKKKKVQFKDIMGLNQETSVSDILKAVSGTVEMIAKSIAEKIVEINGGKPVSAVFIVGGGGKIPGFTSNLAKHLGIAEERVAIRGVEVMKDIVFDQEEIKKDSTLVTPVGICLNFYEQNNNFIFVNVNGERVKIYDNGKLTVVDAALQLGLPNEGLFPRRGKALEFFVNGKKRLVRGGAGEPAEILLNGVSAGLSTKIEQNDKVVINLSTEGEPAHCEMSTLPEYRDKGVLCFKFNGKNIECPRFVMVNDELVSGYYDIKDQDNIQFLNYYTLSQVLEFMDVSFDGTIMINNKPAGMDEKVYENFEISCHFQIGKEKKTQNADADVGTEAEINEDVGTKTDINEDSEVMPETDLMSEADVNDGDSDAVAEAAGEDGLSLQEGVAEDDLQDVAIEDDRPSGGLRVKVPDLEHISENQVGVAITDNILSPRSVAIKKATRKTVFNASGTDMPGNASKGAKNVTVTVNGEKVILKKKSAYTMVDIFDFYPFDLSEAKGSGVKTRLNGADSDFFASIKENDNIEIFWVP